MKALFNKLGIYDIKSFKAFVLQFMKFGIVGISNTLIFFAVYYPLIFLGVHYILASTAAFTLGTLNSFYWNRKHVFKKTDGKKSKQLVKVFIAYGLTYFLNISLLFLFVDIIGISEYIAPLINLIFTTPINFLLNKFWAFHTQK